MNLCFIFIYDCIFAFDGFKLNLVLIFIGLESSSLALYTLIAMRGSDNAISSAIKYFSIAAVGAGFLLWL